MSVSTVAWASQAVVFPVLSTQLRPVSDAGQKPSEPRRAADSARSWARRGCLSVPLLAPLVPSPRSWPLPGAVTMPTRCLRDVGVAVLSFVSYQVAPPAACQQGMAPAPRIGLQGDCRMQREVWTGLWAQTLDGVAIGLVTGAVIVATFALAGAAVGAVQSAGDRVLQRKSHGAPQTSALAPV